MNRALAWGEGGVTLAKTECRLASRTKPIHRRLWYLKALAGWSKFELVRYNWMDKPQINECERPVIFNSNENKENGRDEKTERQNKIEKQEMRAQILDSSLRLRNKI